MNRVDQPTGPRGPSGPRLPIEQAVALERVCDAFEGAWRSVSPPRIEDALADLPEPVRTAAVRELVGLDVYYRRKAGEQTAATDYAARFPDLNPDLLAEAVTEVPEVGTPTAAGAHTAVLPAGTKVGKCGDYELECELARGGMGVVYKARQRSLPREVAVKFLLRGDGPARERFRTEAEAMARLNHPHIARILEVSRGESPPFFSMEWYPGGTLAGRVGEYVARPGRAAEVVERVARAVHFAHQRGVLHRDLKPANILFDEFGRPYVADFGLAVLQSDAAVCGAGTPAYMAPEQITGDVTVATDVHGLGAVLYELLTGRPPFVAETQTRVLELVSTADPPPPRRLNPRVDSDLEFICLRCLEKDPAKRYATAAAMADDLERYRQGRPPRDRRLGPFGRVAHVVRQARAAADFQALGPGLFGMAAFVLASNLAVFGLLRAGAAEGWVWAALFASYVPLFAMLARDRRADRGRHNPGRVYLWAVWAGHATACLAVFVANRIAAGEEWARGIQTGYIGCAGLNALAFVVMGSLFAGRQYLLGLAWAVAAVGMGAVPAWAPLVYAVLIAACSLLTGLQLKALAPSVGDATETRS